MPKPFTLRVITAWRLDYRDREIPVNSRKARALLAYLAFSQGKRHRREALARLLWDTDDLVKARASLRQVIVSLSLLFEETDPAVLQTSRDEVGLAHGAVATDVDALLEAIDAGLQEIEDLQPIRDFRALLGDTADVTTAYAEWVAETIAYLSNLIARRLATVFMDPERPIDARIRTAEAALALDDLDESAVRALMTCHAQAGRSAVALRHYGELFERLAAELDAEPSVETQDLAVEIKLQQPVAKSTLVPKHETTAETESATAARLPAASRLATVAVLPFENLNMDSARSYVTLGLLDQITCCLASFHAPAVISSNSTRQYCGMSPKARDVAKDLNARYVVTGSYFSDAGQALVAVQLIEAETSLVLWADTFRCAEDALLGMRTNIATSIARTIQPNINIAELRRAMDTPIDRLGAYHLVLRAKDLIFRFEREEFDEAGAYLFQAVASEPLSAPAHALLGEWYAIRLWQGWSDRIPEDRQALERHIGRAISLAPGDGRAISLLGHCRMLFDQAHDEAISMFDEALSLCPNDSEALIWTVPTLAYNGQATRAIEHANRAISLSPRDPFRFRNEHFLSIAYYMAGDPSRAADTGLACYRIAPDFGSNLRMTIAALQQAGRRDEAAPLIERHARMLPNFSVKTFMPNHRLRDTNMRQSFAESLIAAGMPK